MVGLCAPQELAHVGEGRPGVPGELRRLAFLIEKTAERFIRVGRFSKLPSKMAQGIPVCA
jgi:hypothetical protein